jgi:hypothetical protein
MSNSVIGALRVVLGADTASFEAGLSGAQKTLKRFGRDMAKVGQQISGIGQTLTLGLTVPIAAFGLASVKAAQQSADAFAQVEVALKSMGGASGRTAEQLQASAKALQNMAAIDDDEILRNVTANLLTFGKVSGPAFDRAQVAIVDLATRMKMQLQPATLLVGKALNDPIKGLTAMGRAGIQFTADQKTMIKSMVDAGNVAGAQAIILGELERQFGGSAKAAADVNPYAKLRIALGELSETIGAKLIPIVQPMVEGLTRLLASFDKLSPAAQQFAVVGAIVAAAIGPLLMVIGSLLGAVSTIAAFMAGPAAAAFGAFLLPLLPIIAGVAALVGVFLLFRDQITPVLKEWAATVAKVLGPKIAPLIEAVRTAFGALAEFVGALFKPGGKLGGAMDVFLSILTRTVGAITSMLGGALDFITGVFNAIGALLRGDWSAMWGYLGGAVMGLIKGVLGAFAAFAPEVISWVRKTWEGVKLWLVDKFTDIVKAVGAKVQAVAGFFKDLWDAVVGHSYVPDMVDGIRDEFARLDEVMVKPALAATAKVNAAFKSVADQMRAANDNAAGGMPTARNGRGPESGGDAGAHNTGSSETKTWGGSVFAPQELEDLRQQFVGYGKDLVGAIKAGKLGEFFQDIAGRFADKLLDRALNGLFDALGQTGGSQGGGFGAILSTVFGGIKVPGFATGGSFTVGGSGGVDSQLAMFRATPGEMVNIRHGNDNGPGGGAVVFDLRGAVMTQDLLNQMNQISAQRAGQVYGQIKGEQAQAAKAQRYRVAR